MILSVSQPESKFFSCSRVVFLIHWIIISLLPISKWRLLNRTGQDCREFPHEGGTLLGVAYECDALWGKFFTRVVLNRQEV